MKKVFITIGAIILLLMVVILLRTGLNKSKQLAAMDMPQSTETLKDEDIDRFLQLLRFRTISSDDNAISSEDEFLALHDFLKESYPLIYENLDVEVIDDYSLFYTWKGKDQNLLPILFSGHIDVVPAVESEWTNPPFSGYADNEFIWGRGSLDNKSIVFSIMEAAEELLKEGYQPDRTICFTFTHDEELGGVEGTTAVANMLESKGYRFEYILDEGGMIASGIISNISKPIAMIGTAEKGAAIVELSVEQEGGTSAVPPKETSIEILSSAINKLKENQLPPKIEGATKQMIEYISPEMGFFHKMALSNLWLFKGLVIDQLSKSSTTAALLKTTTATTIIQGGSKFNIIPTTASAVINYRIIQGDSVDSVLHYVEETIHDSRVSIRLIGYTVEPSPVSDPDAQGFQDINELVKQLFPEVIVTPYLWTGGTNSKHFTNLSDNIYRFSPILIDKTNMSCIHGTDEKISIENLNECKLFYKELMLKSSK